ncbi:apolipoprotein N-acyltransferase [Leucothrix pacifica]|uniref:Apolipoprotein N-acyltransferase n=1 Tax=Leucothrix pacifica TaxID=1247513 RepID=A0A317C7I4_9GAMM|nr:apolipoprotein N-acyltransferase [Leucothrix pacifica]
MPQPDLVIWPESSIAMELRRVYHYLKEGAVALEASGTPIMLGGYRNIGGRMFNSFMQASNPDKYYTKRHLIPFGEYTPDWPFIDLSQFLPEQDMDNLKEGLNQQSLISVAGVKLAVAICYEILFSEELRHDWKEATVLVYISDLSWFKDTWASPQLLQMAQMRAIESGKPLVTSTNHGVTAIIDSHGVITQRVEGEAGYIDGVIIPKSGSTPYTNYGSIYIVGLCFLFVLLGVFRALYVSICRQN